MNAERRDRDDEHYRPVRSDGRGPRPGSNHPISAVGGVSAVVLLAGQKSRRGVNHRNIVLSSAGTLSWYRITHYGKPSFVILITHQTGTHCFNLVHGVSRTCSPYRLRRTGTGIARVQGNCRLRPTRPRRAFHSLRAMCPPPAELSASDRSAHSGGLCVPLRTGTVFSELPSYPEGSRTTTTAASTPGTPVPRPPIEQEPS